jgi:hypothetical protein
MCFDHMERWFAFLQIKLYLSVAQYLSKSCTNSCYHEFYIELSHVSLNRCHDFSVMSYVNLRACVQCFSRNKYYPISLSCFASLHFCNWFVHCSIWGCMLVSMVVFFSLALCGSLFTIDSHVYVKMGQIILY